MINNMAFSNLINIIVFLVCLFVLVKYKKYGLIVLVCVLTLTTYIVYLPFIRALMSLFNLLTIFLVMKNAKLKYIYLSYGFLFVIVLPTFIFLSALEPVPLHSISLLSHDKLNHLVIQYDGDTPYLYDQALNQVITTNPKNKAFYPVYLKVYDQHYIVIFSQDKHKTYEHGYFYQNQLRDNPNEDHLMLIHKESGKMQSMYDIEMVGRNIVLKDIMIRERFLAIPFTYHHERLISFYRTYIIEDMMFTSWTNSNLIGLNAVTNPHMTGYALSKDGLFVYTNSHGEVDLFRISYTITKNEYSRTITSGPNYIVRNYLEEETHFIAGEFAVYDEIYFYSIDGNVYQIELSGNLRLVVENVLIEDWRTSLDLWVNENVS
jgi:hypothetical protein